MNTSLFCGVEKLAVNHLEGNLIFPKLQKGTKSVKLVIKEIGDTDRVFAWNF